MGIHTQQYDAGDAERAVIVAWLRKYGKEVGWRNLLIAANDIEDGRHHQTPSEAPKRPVAKRKPSKKASGR